MIQQPTFWIAGQWTRILVRTLGYNNAHYGATVELADWLDRLAALRPEQYRQANFPLPTENPRFQAMFDHNIDLSLRDR